ncbi:MAG: methyltransferase domain-containing protein, partial [Magnetococcales bacterium]|nr:methyltransferase domain-containing protein [Magnetococcales bacterium]
MTEHGSSGESPPRAELLIGCGRSMVKKWRLKGREAWSGLVTLDINPDHHPDVVWDLTKLPLPFADDAFDEIHAYEVLEHTGKQGDYRFFFAQFSEFWRILRPEGVLIATCPSPRSVWAWGDPSHTRLVQKENLVFLDQSIYTRDVGKTAMSDFRYLYRADFATIHLQEDDETLSFVVRAIKPERSRSARKTTAAPPTVKKPASCAAFLAQYQARFRDRHSNWDLSNLGAVQSGGADKPVEAKLKEMYLP